MADRVGVVLPDAMFENSFTEAPPEPADMAEVQAVIAGINARLNNVAVAINLLSDAVAKLDGPSSDPHVAEHRRKASAEFPAGYTAHAGSMDS